MDAVIILGNINQIDKKFIENKFVIGVDKGAYLAYQNNIRLDVAIGDFDSIDSNMLAKVKENSNRIIMLNSIKDKTDTNEALELCHDAKSITILGGIKGDRIEHFMANIIELINDDRITIIDDNSKIYTKSESFTPDLNYKFFSIFSIDDNTNITLKGFKYELKNYDLKPNNPLGISNEITNNPYVEINSGKLLIISSKDDK